ncbi:MAG: DUF5916 domain-containing protein [Bacteroidota bacterium]
MQRSYALLLLLLPAFAIRAEDTLKSYTAERISSAIKIDGVLDDEAWARAAAASDFVMNQPIEGGVPKQKTEFRIVYDDYAVYVGAMMYDSSPDSILHELGFRDDGNLNADKFRFVFDPYNTRQDAYDFGVYASGVQTDSRFSDYTYDAVWESEVRINEKGWCVEMKIPYSAIRFPKKEVQAWGLQVTRDIRRTREFDQWALTPGGKANPLAYWGTLNGITNIQPPLRLSLTPYLSGYVEKSPEFTSDTTYFYSTGFSYNAGADIKYGIDERFTVDMTLLPDFGQVQSDNKVKNLSYREINYDENRPFFKEGTELFNKGALFYSRRIGKTPSNFYTVPYLTAGSEKILENPSQVKLLNATKLSGRTDGGLGIGLLNAITDNMYATVQDTVTGEKRDILTEPLTNFNVIVFDQQLKNNSKVYFINTNVLRDFDWYDANVTGIGYTLYNKRNTHATDGAFELSQKYSSTVTPNTYSAALGYHYFIGIRKADGRFQYGIGHEAVSKGYDRRDMGYYNTDNFISTNIYFSFNQYTQWKFLQQSYNDISLHFGQHFETHNTSSLNLNGESFTVLKDYTAIFFGGETQFGSVYDYYEPRVEGRYYRRTPYYVFWAGISSDYRKKLAIDANAHFARFWEKMNVNHFDNRPGLGGDVSLRYRFSDKLSARYNLGYNHDPMNDGFANFDTNGDIIFGGRELYTVVNTLTLKYIFRNNMYLSLVGRHYWNTGEYRTYYTLGEFGHLFPNDTYAGNNDFNYNVFNIDMVFSWQFAPGSFLTAVYKNSIENETQVVIKKFGENLEQTLSAPQVNSLSLKVLYYLDYQMLKRRK